MRNEKHEMPETREYVIKYFPGGPSGAYVDTEIHDEEELRWILDEVLCKQCARLKLDPYKVAEEIGNRIYFLEHNPVFLKYES